MTQQFNSTTSDDIKIIYEQPDRTANEPPCFKPRCSTCMYRNNCANFVGESIYTPVSNVRITYE